MGRSATRDRLVQAAVTVVLGAGVLLALMLLVVGAVWLLVEVAT